MSICKFCAKYRIYRNLLKFGADPNLSDKKGNTPFLMITFNFVEIISNISANLLIEYGADLSLKNVYGICPLFSYIFDTFHNKNGEIDICMLNLILKNYDNVDVEDIHKITPLMIVSKYSKNFYGYYTIKMLLEKGANPNLQDNLGWTALHYICVYFNDGNTLPSINLLLEYGADPNIKNDLGITPLMFACHKSKKDFNIQMISLLLKHNANPNLLNSIDYSSFTYICVNPNYETTILLLEYNADPSINKITKIKFNSLLYKKPKIKENFIEIINGKIKKMIFNF